MNIYKLPDSHIFYHGRFAKTENGLIFSWPASGITFCTDSPYIEISVENFPLDIHRCYVTVFVDDQEYLIFGCAGGGEGIIQLHFPTTENRTISVLKRSESLSGSILVKQIACRNGLNNLAGFYSRRPKIEFIGDSLTCGYGAESASAAEGFRSETENAFASFASLTAQWYQADCKIVAWSGRGLMRNWDDYPDPCIPELYKKTIPESEAAWDFTQWIPDLVVINLGTNDYSQGPMIAEQFIKTWLDFIRFIRSQYPDVPIILPMGCGLSNDGQTDKATGKIYPAYDTYTSVMKLMAKEAESVGIKNLCLLPFTGQDEKVRGMGADKHPNAIQHKLNAQELIRFIRDNQLLKSI